MILYNQNGGRVHPQVATVLQPTVVHRFPVVGTSGAVVITHVPSQKLMISLGLDLKGGLS